MEMSPVFVVTLGAILGLILGYAIKTVLVNRSEHKLRTNAEKILNDAEQKAHEVEVSARDKALEIRQSAEAEINRRRSELNREEDRLGKRRADLDNRIERTEQRELKLNKRQSSLDKRNNDLEKLHEDALKQLQEISQMTADEARSQLLSEVEKDARGDMARIIRQIESEAREDGERKARKLVSLAIQRVASDQVAEITSSVVPLPSDEMKGRIIGRNGRNIRAFEQAAAVDVIVDDTPEAVTISCFDPVRREIARRSLAKLVLDGRIHPANIEKTLDKVTDEVDQAIVEAGEQAAFDAGVPSLNAEVLKMLGRLKFRTSYGQNQLAHAVETARIAAMLAAELNADVEISKAGALLHDLGKAMDHNVEGTHAQIGAEFAKRHGVRPEVVHCIASHHHEVEQDSVEAIIVEAADAISGARPGARRESLEQYIKRVRALEEIANSFKGVNQSYALQAGREVRIIVRPDDIDDMDANNLARDIAKQIEETMQYPGQIKVTVIRETRAVDYAK